MTGQTEVSRWVDPFHSLQERWPDEPWVESVCRLAFKKLSGHTHGDLPRWRETLSHLPCVPESITFTGTTPDLGQAVDDPDSLRDLLLKLHPWRKGPLRLGGVRVEAEWRSDWKWDRVNPHVQLAGQRVLDIGCGNGYFGLRMLEAGAGLVVGIDPTLLFVMQWLACRHFSGDIPNFVLPLGIEELPAIPVTFDTVFSMGVLGHRKDPAHHLERIHSMLGPDGMMILETLALPEGRDQDILVPENRYARMRNVWAVPGTARLVEWVRSAGFSEVGLVDSTQTTTGEQRSTAWMRFESLSEALDPADHEKTIEDHPAPVRALLIARY